MSMNQLQDSGIMHFGTVGRSTFVEEGQLILDHNAVNWPQPLISLSQQRKYGSRSIPMDPELTQVACVCVGDLLYLYGSDRKLLSQLDLRAFLWSELWATTDLDNGETPMIKDACGMVYFADGHLGVFGGYAHPSGPLQPGSKFILNTYGDENEGWTNEFHLFNIKTSK